MSYNNAVPASGNTLGNTRVPVQQNFAVLQTIFDKNHVDYNALGGGKHTFLQIPGNALTNITTAAGDGNVYTKTASSKTELFYSPDASGKEYQITSTDTVSYPLFGKFVNNYNSVGVKFTGGWTFLPGGLLLQYGNESSATSGDTITFPRVFSSVFSATVTSRFNSGGGNQAAWIKTITNTNFVIAVSTNGGNISWIAIGLP